MKFQFLPWRLGCGFLCPFVLCVLGPCSDQELSILEKNPYLSPLGFQMILCADAEFGNFYKTKYCKGKKKKKNNKKNKDIFLSLKKKTKKKNKKKTK